MRGWAFLVLVSLAYVISCGGASDEPEDGDIVEFYECMCYGDDGDGNDVIEYVPTSCVPGDNRTVDEVATFVADRILAADSCECEQVATDTHENWLSSDTDPLCHFSYYCDSDGCY